MENDPDVEFNFDTAHSRYLFTAIYAGVRRPLPDTVKRYLAMWVRSFRHPESYVTLFSSEVAIEQGGRRY